MGVELFLLIAYSGFLRQWQKKDLGMKFRLTNYLLRKNVPTFDKTRLLTMFVNK